MLQELGSSTSIKQLVSAMATGGVLSGLDLMPTGGATVGQGSGGFLNALATNAQAAGTAAAIDTILYGGSLGDRLEDNLKNALINAAAATGANFIGDITGDDKLLNTFTNKVAHAIAGCAAGAAKADNSGACGAGALGAAIGEITAEVYGRNANTVQLSGLMAALGAAMAGGSAEDIAIANAAGQNAAANNYLKHDEAKRLADLKDKRLSGQCDSRCEADIRQLEALDRERNQELSACHGKNTPQCTAAVAEVRNSAAEYIRIEAKEVTLNFTYTNEKAETIQLAQQTLDGYTVWNIAKGAAASVADGLQTIANGAYTGFKAVVLQDEQAQTQAKAALGASWDFVSDPANWPQLLGAMSPAQREQLAQAYERGDGQAVAAMLGEQLTNLPTGGSMGTVKTVVRGADRAQEAAVLLQRADVDTVVHVPAGSKGSWDSGINTPTLQPRTAYILDNGHTYTTDADGRVRAVEGTLSLDKLDRNKYQQACAGHSGCAGDDGGHLIASSLGGAGDRINIVPQESTLNRGEWKSMENELRNALNEGKTVTVNIDVGYPDGGGVRPNIFRVTAIVDGKRMERIFEQ